MPIRVKRIDHVTIVIADLQATQAFYVDLLGMKLIDRPAFDFGGMWFQAGNTQIHATLESEEAGSAGVLCDATRPSRSHHFAFQVDDAMTASEHLKSAGVRIVHGPKSRPDGAIQLYVCDPDGHIVELFSIRT